jgi:lactoylglutathione lyase
MNATTIGDVRTIGITVADQDNAIAFYVDTLGFEKRLDAPISPTQRWIEVAPSGAATSLALQAGSGAGDAANDTGIRFTVPDAESEHTALRERGVTVGELLRWEGVPPMFSFDDPDGNRFYVVEEMR